MRKTNEKYVRNAAESLANLVSDSASYQEFIKQMEQLFNSNSITKDEKEIIMNCVYKKFLKNKQVISAEVLQNDFENFKTSTDDHVVIKNSELSKIKEYLNKKRVIAGSIVIGAGVIGFTAVGISKNSKDISTSNSSTPSSIELNNDETAQKNIESNVTSNLENPLLNFNPEDKEVMEQKITAFIKDAVKKGYKIKKGEIANEIQDLINFYLILNMENISSDMLLKLYQSDNISVNDLYDSTFRVLAKLDKDAQLSKDIIDVSVLISNKEFANYIKNMEEIRCKIVTATINKGKEEATKYSKELSKLIKDGINNNNFRKFSANNVLLTLYMGAFPAANSAKTLGLSKVIMSKDVANMVYVEEKCKYALETSKKGKGNITENYRREGTDFENGIFSSIESTENKVDLARETAIKLTEEEKASKYANENSVIAMMNSIKNTIEKENILSTYKANKSYAKLYYKNFKVSKKGKTITKTTVVKSSTAKKITKKKKSGKKVTVKDINSKDFKKGTVKGKSGKKVTTSSKSEQALVEQAAKEGYSAGYNNGNSKGAAGKAKSIGTISVPSKFSKSAKAISMYKAQYRTAFSKGYSDGYKVYKANKDKKTEVVTGSKTTESGVKDVETVKGSSSSNTSSNSSNASNNSSSDSKVEESEVYDIEDVPVTKNSVKSSLSEKIDNLKQIRDSISNLNIESSYEEELTHQK